jgi:coatomer protein complex subunit alpha (xenin)
MDKATRSSPLAADSIAAGRFEDAMRLLHQQICIVNFQPLKPHFLRIFQAANANIIGIGSLPPLKFYLERDPPEGQHANKAGTLLGPIIALSLQSLINELTEAYKFITNGKFPEAETIFKFILQAIPLVVARNKSESDEIKLLIEICREYLIGIATEIERKEVVNAKGSTARILELASYFTLCNLQSKHSHFTLRSAMNAHAKANNYALAGEFARRLLDSNPPPALVEHTQRVLLLCEKKAYSDAIRINFDPRNPCVLCGSTLTPIYQGSAHIKCLYCGTAYKPEFSGKLCNICGIAEIGKQGSGLITMEIGRKKNY